MANTPNLDLENVNVLLDTDYAYNQLVTEIISKINNNNLKIDGLPNNFIPSSQKGEINGVATLGNDGIIPKTQLPTDSGSVERVADITARDAIVNLYDNKLVFVIDASDDETVTSGWAMYIYSTASSSWTKIADAESLDIQLTWDNIANKPTVFPPDTHTHEQIETNTQNISDLQNNKVDKIEGSRLVSETEIEVFNDKYSKTEIDDKLSDLSSDAIDINYSNATSSLTSTNVQGAIDELDNLDVIIRNNDLDDVIANVIPLDADLFNGQNANYYAKQTDLSNVNTKVGSENLSTTSQNLSGAINEHEAQINTFAPHLTKLVTDAEGVHGLNIEQGVIIPKVGGSIVSGILNYGSTYGTYQKINNKITVKAYITISASGHTTLPTGNMIITGLPFANSNKIESVTVNYISRIKLPANSLYPFGRIPANANYIEIVAGIDDTAFTNVAAEQGYTAAKVIAIEATYYI